MKYNPIPTEDLKIDMILNFDIYIESNSRIILYRRKNLFLGKNILDKLIDHKISTIFVSEDDMGELNKYYKSIKKKISLEETIKCFEPPFDKPETVEKYHKTYTNYHPIEKETLIAGAKVNFNVYKKKNYEVELFFGPESQKDKPEIIPKDVQGNHRAIVIQNTDIPLYKEYLKNISKEFSNKKDIPIELRCSVIRENSKLVVKDVLEDPRSGDNIKKSNNVVEILVDTILENKDNFYNLLNITSYDYYTYTHSLNVCTLSIGLGVAMNLKNEPTIRELGLGALLHDAGKSTIDPNIINKPGRLTKEEFTFIKQHVAAGKKILKENNNIPENAFIPILQHHEKLSGKGYPYGLRGMEIDILGRITGIVDVYDALTTERSYKKAFSPYDALQILSENSEDYDQNVLDKFKAMLGY